MILADIEDDLANNFATIGSNHLLSASLTNNKPTNKMVILGSSNFFMPNVSAHWSSLAKNIQKLFQVNMAPQFSMILIIHGFYCFWLSFEA